MNYDELDLSRFSLETTSPLKCIAGIFPENRLTLLHGVQGSGKTYSTIKALNRAKIKPIYLALEGTDGLDGLDFDGVNSGLLKVLMDHTNTYSPLKGRTVIIDTYTVLRSIWFVPHGDGSDESLTSKLIWMCKHHDITLIVIGHTKQNAGISNTFVDNLHWFGVHQKSYIWM